MKAFCQAINILNMAPAGTQLRTKHETVQFLWRQMFSSNCLLVRRLYSKVVKLILGGLLCFSPNVVINVCSWTASSRILLKWIIICDIASSVPTLIYYCTVHIIKCAIVITHAHTHTHTHTYTTHSNTKIRSNLDLCAISRVWNTLYSNL
jgi:hypothetical protein